MKFRIVVHEAEEGGFWAEVPALPGCLTQGETMDELMANVREAIEVCREVLNDRQAPLPGPHDKSVHLLDIAV